MKKSSFSARGIQAPAFVTGPPSRWQARYFGHLKAFLQIISQEIANSRKERVLVPFDQQRLIDLGASIKAMRERIQTLLTLKGSEGNLVDDARGLWVEAFSLSRHGD
jgi:hypothetical protein